MDIANQNNKSINTNDWLLWCLASIFVSYLLGHYFAIWISFLIATYKLPVFVHTLLISLTPPAFLISGILLLTAIKGDFIKLIHLCRFRNWKFFYFLEVVGLELFFLVCAFAFTKGLLYLKKIFPEFYRILEMYSNSPQIYIKQTGWVSFAILATVAIVLAPIVEEIVFRAVMFNGLKIFTNEFTALITTSLVFALLHFNFIQFIPLFILGLFFQYLYISHKSIYPGILFHAFHNGVSMTFLFLMKLNNWDVGF